MHIKTQHGTAGGRILVAFIALLLGACEPPPEPVIEPVRVVVTPAVTEDVTIYGDYVGRTQASKRVEVNPRVDGFLEEITFVDGSLVSERAVLYRIDPAPYQADLDRAQAILKSREAALAKSRRDLDRIRPLFEEDAASQLDHDNAIAAVQQGEAALMQAQAELRNATLNLEYTELKAPIGGMIGESGVDVGALIRSSSEEPLTTIRQIDPMFVYFSMSALDYLNARRRVRSFYEDWKSEREGKALEGEVSLTLPDDTLYKFTGAVGFTDPQVDPQTGTFAIRAIVPNPDRELLPGQYTRVRMPLEVRKNALLVPEECIAIEQGGVYVYVALPSNIIERRLIFVGPTVEGRITVEKGLDPGEQIVIHGINKVYQGSPVDPISLEQYERELAEADALPVEAASEAVEGDDAG